MLEAPAEPPAPPPPREAAARPPFDATLQAFTRRMQQAALEQGTASVERTLDDRLYIRLPIASLFDGGTTSSRRVQPFLRTLASALAQHEQLLVAIAENPQRLPAPAAQPAIKPHPRAANLLRYLIGQGVNAGRLSIAPHGTLQPDLPATQLDGADKERCIEFLVSQDGH